jgi:dipeptidyl-peptidase-4
MKDRTVLIVILVIAILLGGQILPSLAASSGSDHRLSIEAIYGELSGSRLLEARWAPDGERLSWTLIPQDGGPELWVADRNNGEKELLLSVSDLTGLTAGDGGEWPAAGAGSRVPPDYAWSPAGDALLINFGGRLMIYDIAKADASALVPSMKGVSEATFSPDGTGVAFVHAHDLWFVPAAGGEARRLTSGGSEILLHGEVDWVYEEEFDVRHGYHWSPDGRFIAFLEMDEQSVPTYPILDELENNASVELQRYPKAGDPNPRVRVGMVEVATGKTAWLDRRAEYVPRIDWTDSDTVAVQLMNRAQNELQLVFADPKTGKSRSIDLEQDEHWINVTHDLTFLDSGAGFLWTSERTGYRHIYRCSVEGKLLATLTSGDWEVKRLEGLDEEQGRVYFTSNEANPLGRDLYRVSLDGGKRERITTGEGTHRVTMNEQANAYLDNHSSLKQVPRAALRNLAGGSALEIHAAPSVDHLNLVAPELIELKAPDGALVRVKLLKPQFIERGRKYPVLVYVYGGPHSPVISDSWRVQGALFQQLLVQRGFIVASVDDRASSLLGHAHEIALWRNWGPVAAEDHKVAVEYLRSLPFVDPDRLAVWGWSGGGYTTCYHMTHTDLFKVGVAVAPVTDWHLYDSIYTERYMGLPEDEKEAYERTSVILAADKLNGRLLIVHGTHDDNVHPQNTTQAVQAFIEAGKPVDMMLYPNKKHGIRGTAQRTHLFNKIIAYLEEHL